MPGNRKRTAAEAVTEEAANAYNMGTAIADRRGDRKAKRAKGGPKSPIPKPRPSKPVNTTAPTAPKGGGVGQLSNTPRGPGRDTSVRTGPPKGTGTGSTGGQRYNTPMGARGDTGSPPPRKPTTPKGGGGADSGGKSIASDASGGKSGGTASTTRSQRSSMTSPNPPAKASRNPSGGGTGPKKSKSQDPKRQARIAKMLSRLERNDGGGS